MSVRTSRLELMKRQIELDGLKLYDKEDAMLRKRLQKEAMDEVERQAGILSLSETTRKSLVRGAAEVINGTFHGAPFSSRIWANKNELVARLQVGLERSILQGEHPDRWARLFTDLVSAEMGEKAGRALFAARRLAITESARVMSEIQLNSFEKGGYRKYIWITEIDDRTCPVCSALDGEVFDIDRSEIGANLPPLHPFCRCSVAAYVDNGYNVDEPIEEQSDEAIRSWIDDHDKVLNHEKFEEHHDGSKRYNPEKSKINIPEKRAQELIYDRAGSGELRRNGRGLWTKKEFITDKRFLGEVEGNLTHRFSIEYKDKKWVHIVPRKEGGTK